MSSTSRDIGAETYDYKFQERTMSSHVSKNKKDHAKGQQLAKPIEVHRTWALEREGQDGSR